MRAALILLAGCAGVHGSLATAREAVRDDYCRGGRCAEPPKVEYLGEGCYLVDDGLVYGCTTDLLPVGERLCMSMPQGEVTVTYETCSFELTGPATCRTQEPPRHCLGRAAQHDKGHGRLCTVRVRVRGDAGSSEVELAISKDTIGAVLDAHRLGMTAVQLHAKVCAGSEPDVERSSGFPRLDAVALEALASYTPATCASQTVVIDRWEDCVL